MHLTPEDLVAGARALGEEPPADRILLVRPPPRMTPVNVWDYERLAAEVLDAGAHGYYAGGAADELTLRDNVAAFRRCSFGRGCWSTSKRARLATTVLGQEISMPLLVAPVAFQRVAHPDGEVAMARAARAAGTIMCLSTLATATRGGRRGRRPALVSALRPPRRRR